MNRDEARSRELGNQDGNGVQGGMKPRSLGRSPGCQDLMHPQCRWYGMEVDCGLKMYNCAVIQKSTTDKCFRGCGEKGTLLHCWWECKLVQPLWRTVWRFLKKLEIELPYDRAISLLGTHTEETRIERDTCTPMFIVALFIIARTWKQPRCLSADKWIRKLCAS